MMKEHMAPEFTDCTLLMLSVIGERPAVVTLLFFSLTLELHQA